VRQPVFLIFSFCKGERAVHIVSIGLLAFFLSLFGYDNGNIGLGLGGLSVACQWRSTGCCRKEVVSDPTTLSPAASPAQ